MTHRPTRKTYLPVIVSVVLVSGFLVMTAPFRALAVPSSPLVNGQDTLFFVGDSLTVGTEAFGKLQSRLEGLNIWDQVLINARVGRRTDQSVRLLASAMPKNATALVVALGTNDVISRREPWYPSWVINEVMEAAAGRPVLWFNTEFSPTGRGDWRFRSRRFNRALRAAQTEWNNLVIADWYGYFVPKGKTRFQSDGVHLSTSAYKLRAQYTEVEVRQFGEQVVNATSTTTIAPTTTLPVLTTSPITSLPATSLVFPTSTVASTTTVVS